jgi:hypothetical protein
MWGISLADMLDTMGIDAVREMPRMPGISNKLNAGKFAHADENSSFEQIFLSELAGVLDSLESEFREMFSYLYEHVTGMTPAMEDAPAADAARLFANLIYHGFRLTRFSTELPALRIPATLHAAIRWDTARKFRPNDIHDIRHAEAALPYFETFLTEHSLRHLLTRSDLALDRLYDCRVISEPHEAITEIERVISQPATAPDRDSAAALSRQVS